ncbi:ancient ubiquitous protein 1 [Cephus cinctus]|uniref:Lipid droplet-regulating VLDL assembly factor AUP1 n=1 Tax=Cephus cinctus TaxID=211228 RepID=A0AAJ7FU07_CEPCN|nr:ancient ubiquitous protein 1 [Cephus cinctus]
MSQIDIKDLFDESRFPSGWRLVSLLLYSPVGLVLVFLRFLVGLQLWLLASVLPDCDALRTILNHGLAFVFGILVKIDPKGEIPDKQTRIIIANNISALDHFALRKGACTLTPSLWDLPSALSNALGLQDMNMSSKDALIANIKEFLASSEWNIALQPEFGSTNSRVALLKFNSWPFSIEPSVQPVVITTRRPEFSDIRLTSVASTWWTDVFWFMFVPYTMFNLRYLKVKRNSNQEVLARNVETDIAEALHLSTSNYTVSDKTEFEKRYVLEKTQSRAIQSRVSTNPQPMASIEMQRMARQVSEVLPLVPHNVILRDLLKTRNVDVTIANILDGIVTYTPEPTAPAPSSSSNISKVNVTLTKDGNGTGSLTFQQRKAKMIAEARERYILKHGLGNC